VERPSSLHKEVKEDVLHEIENENQVVSKFMTESTEEKKNEGLNEIAEWLFMSLIKAMNVFNVS